MWFTYIVPVKSNFFFFTLLLTCFSYAHITVNTDIIIYNITVVVNNLHYYCKIKNESVKLTYKRIKNGTIFFPFYKQYISYYTIYTIYIIYMLFFIIINIVEMYVKINYKENDK